MEKIFDYDSNFVEYPKPIKIIKKPFSTNFESMITPLQNISSECNNGYVKFIMKRKNKTVSLQWEPFTADLSNNGVSYLTVTQQIPNLPDYKMLFPIIIKFKGEICHTSFEIDPFSNKGNCKIYINQDHSSKNTKIGDNIEIFGSCVSWIIT